MAEPPAGGPSRPRGWRLAVGRAAVVATVAIVVLQASELLLRMGPFSGLPRPYLTWFPVLYSSALAAAGITAVVSTILALRGDGRPASLTLAAASALFTLCCLTVLGLLAPWDRTDNLFGEIVRRLNGYAPGFAIVGVAAFLRFTVLFPRPLTAAEVAGVGHARTDDSLGRSGRWVARAVRLVRGRSGGGQWRKGRARVARLVPAGLRRLASRRVVVDAGRLLTEPRLLWTTTAVVALLPYLAWWLTDRAGPDLVLGGALVWMLGALSLLTWMVVPPTGVVIGIALLRLGYGLADERDRRRMRWIVEGLNVTVWAFLALTPFALMEALGVRNPVVSVIPALVFGILPLLTATAFAVAVFYAGALEPKLVIRKGALVGAAGFGLAFTFAIVEEVVTEHLTARLGMPEGAGTLAASGVVAVIIGGFYGRFRSILSSQLASREGDTGGARS